RIGSRLCPILLRQTDVSLTLYGILGENEVVAPNLRPEERQVDQLADCSVRVGCIEASLQDQLSNAIETDDSRFPEEFIDNGADLSARRRVFDAERVHGELRIKLLSSDNVLRLDDAVAPVHCRAHGLSNQV